MIRVGLYLKVYLFRLLSSAVSLLNLRRPSPAAPTPTFTLSIPTTSRKRSGQVKLLFYTPTAYKRPGQSKKSKEDNDDDDDDDDGQNRYPIVVNFHGGGYTVGDATQNARFAAHVTEQLSAVFIGVEYGLAPEHPYPTAIGDCVDSLLWLWNHASDLNLDAQRTVLTGCSAGGTLALVTSVRIHTTAAVQQNTANGAITGIVAFYPGVDWTQTRAERIASNPISATKGGIPSFAYKMFDNSYLGPSSPNRPDLSNTDFSPARAADEILQRALPDTLAIYSCEYDQLYVEDEEFRKRLRGLGKRVGGYMAEGEGHGWDLRLLKGEKFKKRRRMYEDAVQEMTGMLAA